MQKILSGALCVGASIPSSPPISGEPKHHSLLQFLRCGPIAPRGCLINLPPKSPPPTTAAQVSFWSSTLQLASDTIAVSPECSVYRVSQAAFSLSPSSLGYAGRLLAVDRPGDAELIDARAKADRPEGVLERHLHCAVFRKRVKYPFCIHRIIDAKQH